MPLDPTDRFEEQFKAWASKPPRTPADQAARRVLRRLPPATRPALSWFRLAAAAAVVLVLGAGLYFREPPGSPVVSAAAVGRVDAPLVPEGVALIWLESGTPLYLTLNPPPEPDGGPTS